MNLCNILWTKKSKRKGHYKINEQIKRNLYKWITRHPKVVQSPISNVCLEVVLDDQIEPQLVPKLLLQVSVRELHNSLVSDPNDGGNSERNVESLIIILPSSPLASLIPPSFGSLTRLLCSSLTDT